VSSSSEGSRSRPGLYNDCYGGRAPRRRMAALRPRGVGPVPRSRGKHVTRSWSGT
jgi:hypothetical protein